MTTAAEGTPNARKKAKLDGDEEDSLLSTSAELAATAWGHYRNYLDALDDDDDEDNNNANDNELKELRELLSGSHISPFEGQLATIRTEADMLPLLASVLYYQLASTAISTYLTMMANAKDDQDETGKQVTVRMRQQAQQYMDKSLYYFPANAALWSMGANFGRITFTLTPASIVVWYQQAAECASRVRRETLFLLETKDYGDDSGVKEWMELLLLQQVVGVEYVVDDDKNGEEEEEQLDNEEEEGYFSASSIEGTARFMAAMLLSRGGDHARALQHLQEFPLTHRLHPNVWTGDTATGLTTTAAATSAIVPVSFHGGGGVLPPKLYQRMCMVFAPDAVYWKESDYGNRGYYSFFSDIDNNQPLNLIHDVVVNHLLPLAKRVLANNNNGTAPEIVAYEWWAHSREFQANLGHTLHFDTDECILAKEEDMHHPILSSVLHITGDCRSGATIVFDQTPTSEKVANKCWRSVPLENTFMVFPGNLLHGVLPCPGITASNSDDADAAKQEQWVTPTGTANCPHRLTFMVGFKTRRVPDQRKEEGLYGPCGPLPPDTEEWVKEIHRGYEAVNHKKEKTSRRSPRQESIRVEELPSVSPAWECIPKVDEAKGEKPPLPLPSSIDHRFFVNGAPQCFRESIFDGFD